jgi:hypothetical protein
MKKLVLIFFVLTFVLAGSKAVRVRATSDRMEATTITDHSVSASFDPAIRTVPLPTPKPAKANAVCPDPAMPCDGKGKSFSDWELPFKMPAKLLPGKSYVSEKFYAVMLKTYPDVDDCDGGNFIEAVETERKSEQKDHPGRKVFASYECPDLDAVGYAFEGRLDAKGEKALVGTFLAVYAGETREDATSLLAKLKSKYPNAVVKQMTATFEVIDQ